MADLLIVLAERGSDGLGVGVSSQVETGLYTSTTDQQDTGLVYEL